MPYAIAGVGRSVGPFKRLGPRFQVMVPSVMANPWMVRKLVEQWLEKSGDFYLLLRWSVGCHQRLRSRCTHFQPDTRNWLSALTLIASSAETNEHQNGVLMLMRERRMHGETKVRSQVRNADSLRLHDEQHPRRHALTSHQSTNVVFRFRLISSHQRETIIHSNGLGSQSPRAAWASRCPARVCTKRLRAW